MNTTELQKKAPYLLLSLFSFFLMIFLMESSYRVYKYIRLQDRYYNYGFQVVEAELYQYDAEHGYRYLPAIETTSYIVDETYNIFARIALKTNEQGWLSDTDYALVATPRTYRIVVLGDSFTAGIMSGRSWVHFLATLLNEDAALKTALDVDTIEVLNFGMDGIGFVQFADIYLTDAQHYQPDLVIINFIASDILRPFVWRQMLPPAATYTPGLQCYQPKIDEYSIHCTYLGSITVAPGTAQDPAALESIHRALYDRAVDRMPWFSPHSEVLAMAQKRPLLVFGKVYYQNTNGVSFSDAEGLHHSVAAIESIAAHAPELLIFQHPTYSELSDKERDPLGAELDAQLVAHSIVDMAAYLPQVDDEELYTWYYAPYDRHQRVKGEEIYAGGVYAYLREYLLAQP